MTREQPTYRSSTTSESVTRENVLAMRQLDEAARAQRTFADRIASAVAGFCGSMTFVVIHIVWYAGWIAWNVLPWFPHFDEYPFTLLLLMVSLEAIFLSTFILISQNYEMRISERRNQLDLQINLLSEQENTKMLQLLERVAQKVGVEIDDARQVRALEKATRPESLVAEIEEAYREDAGQPPLPTPTPAPQTKGG